YLHYDATHSELPSSPTRRSSDLSGLQAVLYGCMQIQTGAADLVIAGGAESMSQAEFYATDMRWGTPAGGVMLKDRLARSRVTARSEEHTSELQSLRQLVCRLLLE